MLGLLHETYGVQDDEGNIVVDEPGSGIPASEMYVLPSHREDFAKIVVERGGGEVSGEVCMDGRACSSVPSVIGNPLLDAWRAAYGQTAPYSEGDRSFSPLRLERRHDACARWAWAVPGPEAISALVALGPLVEIGAGTGYWARLITDAGGDVVAYDLNPPGETESNHWHPYGERYFEVVKGDGIETVRAHADRALLLCWPPYAGCSEPDNAEELAVMRADDMGYQVLVAYREVGGRTLAYVGEGDGGCTGGWPMHRELAERWCEEQTVSIPQWLGIHDTMTIYRVKDDRLVAANPQVRGHV